MMVSSSSSFEPRESSVVAEDGRRTGPWPSKKKNTIKEGGGRRLSFEKKGFRVRFFCIFF